MLTFIKADRDIQCEDYKYYHMQKYFECPVVLNRNGHIIKGIFVRMAKTTPCVNWTFDGDARDMVDLLAGVKSKNSSVMFVS